MFLSLSPQAPALGPAWPSLQKASWAHYSGMLMSEACHGMLMSQACDSTKLVISGPRAVGTRSAHENKNTGITQDARVAKIDVV
jgi:hypothetical protein